MLTPDTFLLTLYGLIDDFCKDHLPEVLRPGPAASLDRREVLTLAIFSPWGQFRSERAFYRYATRHLRSAFPTLPVRSQYDRLVSTTDWFGTMRARSRRSFSIWSICSRSITHPTRPAMARPS